MRNKKHMILLRRPFMATTKTVIDVQNGKWTMTVSGETIESKAVDSMPYPFATFHSQCYFFSFIDLLVSKPSF